MISLRPTTLDGVIGQKQTVRRLRILIKSCQQRGAPFPHCMFTGGPGLGKTMLTRILANELGVEILVANAPAITRVQQVLVYLAKLTTNSILYFDEAHRLKLQLQNFLLPVIEEGKVNLSDEAGEVIDIDLPPFCFVCSTTDAGALVAPLRDRFKVIEYLKPYSVTELVKLVKINAVKLNMKVEGEAAQIIAGASKSVPRLANSLLEWVRDFGIAHDVTSISSQLVKDALTVKEVSLNGLTVPDRKYLALLGKVGRPIGLSSISDILGIEEVTIKETIEPFLMRTGRIIRTSKGRILV